MGPGTRPMGSATNDNTLGISVAIDGTKVRVTRRTTSSGGSITSGASADASPLFGWLEGNAILASNNKCTMVLVRDAAPLHAAIVSQPIAAAYDSHPSLPSPDGLWRGTYKCEPRRGDNGASRPFVIDLNLRLTNGSATWRTAGPSRTNGFSFDVAVSVVRDVASVARRLHPTNRLGNSSHADRPLRRRHDQRDGPGKILRPRLHAGPDALLD